MTYMARGSTEERRPIRPVDGSVRPGIGPDRGGVAGTMP